MAHPLTTRGEALRLATPSDRDALELMRASARPLPLTRSVARVLAWTSRARRIAPLSFGEKRTRWAKWIEWRLIASGSAPDSRAPVIRRPRAVIVRFTCA